MFPAPSNLDLSYSQIDLHTKELEPKWKGLFIGGLKRIETTQLHSVKAKEDALDYVEKLLVQLLGMVCSRPYPHTVQAVQERVQKLLAHPFEEWVIEEATKALKQGKRKGDIVVFPIDKIHPLLKELVQHRIDHNVTVYITAVLEYIAADVLNLVGNYIKHSRRGEFSMQDVKAAVGCDKVLCDLFKLGDNLHVNDDEDQPLSPVTRTSVSSNELVEDFLQSERLYLRDLLMLVKVFWEQLTNKLEENESLDIVFQSVEDIVELTVSLISQIEDTIEMTEPNQIPGIGGCFLELAENWEFDVYDRYAEAYNEDCQRMLEEILNRPDVEKKVSTAGKGVVDAIKFYFPKLLLEPYYHISQYFEFITLMMEFTTSDTDKTDFMQAESILTSLKVKFQKFNIQPIAGEFHSRVPRKNCKQYAQSKVSEIKKLVEGFGDSYGQSSFNEYFYEGEFLKISSGKRSSERFGYLFDTCFLLCKPHVRRTSVVTGGSQFDYRLKETFYLSRMEVRDKEDTDEFKFLFEIVPRGDESPILLSCATFEDKRNWMAYLVMLTTKSMLDRFLDRSLSDEEKKHPLQLPPSDKYRFAVPDSEENIIFDRDNGNSLVIKGATLLKLVERLTHHQYSDPNFVNTFLTTYRSFCSPHEFLDLLIERFHIPEPEFSSEHAESIFTREMLKRFRKEYQRHVHLRVLNVMKQWVMHHFYDFERDPSLQDRLEKFLETNETRGKNCIFESVRRCLKKTAESMNSDSERILSSAPKSPPPIEYHLKCYNDDRNILTHHPIELARQLTLIEFDYYRVVKPSELVGSVWTKKNKDKLSPNLLKMIKHTTNVTRWFEKTIVDTENLEERTAIVSRILEIMIVMQELNNFNGVLAVVSAMGSASVHRLSSTFQGVNQRLIKALEDAQDLQNDHYKKYQERLRSINPPCVPFFGMYLTNILHIEEGNLDVLPNTDLINFGKRRKVAEITSEIRQFQYSHYCFAVEPRIREYIERLQPFPPEMTENEISNYLYERSLEIEPRGAKQIPKFPRKWPELNLKSPGIKRNGRNHPGPLPSLSFGSPSTFSLNTLQSTRNLASDQDFSTESSQQTPKTPSSITSNTSPQDDNQEDFSIFAPVLIGNSLPTMQISSRLGNPPPLPPRPRPRNDSAGDSLSPRLNDLLSDKPPPLPPRKVSPRTPNPPVPRRNSSSTAELSPHANVSPMSPTKRLNNGPLLPSNSPSTSGMRCSSEHNHSSSRFDFPAGSPAMTISPLGPKPPIMQVSAGGQVAPKLPPKSIKKPHS